MSSLGLGGGGSFTPLGKGLAVALVAGSLGAALSPRFLAAAGLVSARAISRPWTLVTCAFVGSPATALPYAVAALFLARIVEPLQGARGLAKYLGATLAAASGVTVAIVTLGYYLSLTDTEASIREVGAAGALLFRPLGGFEAGVAALLVAIKQLIPDNEVALLGGALRFRAQHLPSLYALAATAGSLALGGAVRCIPMALAGTYWGWAYLRFAQLHEGGRGDLSPDFALATFFPRPMQPLIERCCAACTRLTGLGAPGGDGYAPVQSAADWRAGLGGAPLHGSSDGDSQRRRERGAKALEERLGGLKGSGGSLKRQGSVSQAPSLPTIMAGGTPGASAASTPMAAAPSIFAKAPLPSTPKAAAVAAAAAVFEADVEAGASNGNGAAAAVEAASE